MAGTKIPRIAATRTANQRRRDPMSDQDRGAVFCSISRATSGAPRRIASPNGARISPVWISAESIPFRMVLNWSIAAWQALVGSWNIGWPLLSNVM
jgi:hypothetical protein